MKPYSFSLNLSVFLFVLVAGYSLSFGQTTLTISLGDIPANKSVTITFAVTVNSIATGACLPSISHQGTITGANFSPVLTDDPDTPASTDATVTTIHDNQPPLINCPGDVTVTLVSGTRASVLMTAATITDNCTGASITNNSLFALSNGSNATGSYPSGTTAVTFVGTDSGSNMVQCTMLVTVVPAPLLVFPAHGSTDHSLTTTLRWDAVPNVPLYDLELARDAGFTLGVQTFASLGVTSQSVNLTASTTYFWRVRTRQPAFVGEYSTTSTFATINNGPPVISTNNNVLLMQEDEPFLLTMSVFDDVTPATAVVLSVTSADVTILPNTNIAQQGATGALTQFLLTPATNANGGPFTLWVSGRDGIGQVGTTTLQVTVQAVNDPPTITALGPLEIDANSMATVSIMIDDIDDVVGSLVVTATSGNQTLLPDANLNLSATAATMLLELTPECFQSGLAPVTIRVNDAEPLATSASFVLTVRPVPALVISGATVCACPDIRQSYSVAAVTGASYVWSAAGAVIGDGQGSASAGLHLFAVSSASVAVEVTYPSGCVASTTLLLQPKVVIGREDYVTTSVGLTTTALVTANDIGTSLVFVDASTAAHGQVSTSAGGQVSYTPAQGFEGIDIVNYRLRDLSGCVVTGALVVHVQPTTAHLIETSYMERLKDRRNGVRGLRNVNCVAVSPDGRHVYAVGQSEHSLLLFDRAADGSLSYVGRERHGSGGVLHMKYPLGVALSPDGRDVYVASYGSHAVVQFARDASTGALQFVASRRQGEVDGGATINALSGARSVAVSPDGKNVYVGGYKSNAVAVFRRDASTGRLQWQEGLKDNTGGVNGLGKVIWLALSPDGSSLYSAGYGDHGIGVFARSRSDGSLTYVECRKDGVGGIDGLRGVKTVTVSPDGRHVYAAGFNDKAVALFNRDAATSSLSYVRRYKDGLDGVDGLGGACGVSVSASGTEVWATGQSDNGLAIFQRDAVTGELAYSSCLRDGVDGVDGLSKVVCVAVSPDNGNAYCAGRGDHALSVFRRNRLPVAVDDSGLIVVANSTLVIKARDNDSDGDGDPLSISAKTNGALGTATITGGGTTLTYSAGAAGGPDSFTYTISDGRGGSSTATVSLTVVLPKQGVDERGDAPSLIDMDCLACSLNVQPNPFHDNTSIDFTLAEASTVRLLIRDMSGRRVSTIIERRLPAGVHSYQWRTATQPSATPAGFYVVELTVTAPGRMPARQAMKVLHLR